MPLPGNIRCAEDIGQPHQYTVIKAFGSSTHEGDCFGTIIFFDSLKLICNYAKRLIPWDSLPLTFSPLANPFEGIFKTVWMVKHFQGRLAFDTESTLIYRTLGVPFYSDRLTTFHMDEYPTATMADVTGASNRTIRNHLDPSPFPLPQISGSRDH
jgi:hypothetical protein